MTAVIDTQAARDDVQGAPAGVIPFGREDARAWLALSAAWIALALIVDPRGDFPLNDDWAYGLPVESWVEAGKLRLTFWQSMPLLPQLAWGALFSLPFGFSFTALRVSTLVLGLAGVLGLHRLLRERGVAPPLCLLGAATLLVNPVYVGLANSFMTDVPFTALLVLATIALLRALDAPGPGPLIAGTALAVTAALVRQIGVLLMLAFVLVAMFRWGFGRKWLLRAIVPFACAVAVQRLGRVLIERTVGLPKLYDAREGGLTDALTDLAAGRLGALRLPIERTFESALYLGLFTLPILLPLLLSNAAARRKQLALTALAGGALAALLLGAGYRFPRPTGGNILLEAGIGPYTSAGAALEAPVARALLTLLASLGLAALLAMLARRLREIARAMRHGLLDASALFATIVAVLGFGPLALAYGPFFDRYLLFIVPLLLLVLMPAAAITQPRALQLAPALILLLGFGLFSAAGTHDYLAWSRARRQAASELYRSGVAREQVEAGFELDNYTESRAYMFADSTAPGIVDRTSARYALVFSPAEGDTLLRSHATHAWFPSSPARVVTVERTRPEHGRQP